MASALDVAQYILEDRGPMTAMKLQKLVYYCQVWSVVWDDDELFGEQIHAFENGPVVRELWEAHRGQFRVRAISGGDVSKITDEQGDTIARVLGFYGDKNAQWLSDLTHLERPWREAWDNCRQGGSDVISLETIAEYYSSIEPPSGAE